MLTAIGRVREAEARAARARPPGLDR
jgi:hypothetical protein